ncbi:short-chain dehydrogenase/reductase SDR [Hyaloraphidium curvatum]|nr:short-chain dehydrogenase/reductase SDR [Hyaloraphidium curvatum]
MKVAITGASRPRGIGFAIATAFTHQAAPCHLLLAARTKDALEARAAELGALGLRSGTHADAFAADLSTKEGAQGFAEFVLTRGRPGPPDVLVNNSGSYVPGTTSDEPEGALRRMLEANLLGAYELTRALLPSMVERGSGLIVNVCSVASLRGFSNGGSYSIAKHALAGFSRNLREETKGTGVKVTAIYPGATLTESWDQEGVGAFDGRPIMEPRDVAAMIVCLANLSPGSVVEEIVMRPQGGDL